MQRQNDSIYGIWGQKERRKADIEGRMAGRQVGKKMIKEGRKGEKEILKEGREERRCEGRQRLKVGR